MLPFLDLGDNGDMDGSGDVVSGAGRLTRVDDGSTPPINLPSPLSFGNYTVRTAYVGSL